MIQLFVIAISLIINAITKLPVYMNWIKLNLFNRVQICLLMASKIITIDYGRK